VNMFNTFKVLTTASAVLFLASCGAEQAWLKPTGSAASVPEDPDLKFEQYVAESKKNIQQVITKLRFSNAKSPYVGEYSASDVANMRGPFQLPEKSETLCADKSRGAGKGFLLIHGLTDSPYLLKNVGQTLADAYPCGLVRAVLLPGHGTVVGDTLDMKYQDWMGITEYGVHSFQKMPSIDELYLVGFSTGTALAIKYLKEGASQEKIKGLVLLSTAVKAKSDLAWLTSYIKVFKSWLGTAKERDAARYSSFSTNAGAQFYKLTKGLVAKEYQFDIPVLMAVSADDETINPEAAREFFCKYTTSERKLLLWYKGFSKAQTEQCDGVYEIEKGSIHQEYRGVKYRYANLAHTGLSVSPSDSHYGVSGVYRDCKSYESADDDSQWRACMQDSANPVFAEKNVAKMSEVLAGGMWRRGTFNKQYQQLAKTMVCFTDQHCDLKKSLRN